MQDIKTTDQIEEIFPEKLEDAIDSTAKPFISTEVLCGYVRLEDGRKAQVIVRVETDQDEWLDD